MNEASNIADQRHWGRWIMERAKLVGIGTAAELAILAGCDRRQLSRWRAGATPPRMFGGRDLLLAKALKIDLQTLFNGYLNFAAADAGIIETPSPLEDFTAVLRREVHAMVELLHVDELRRTRANLQQTMREYLSTETEEHFDLAHDAQAQTV